jgi:hypothetical protein
MQIYKNMSAINVRILQIMYFMICQLEYLHEFPKTLFSERIQSMQ